MRLTEGDYNTKKEYSANPLEMAKRFESFGIKRLHLVDLDGAKARKVVNWHVVEQLTAQTSLSIDFGGGVQSDIDIQRLFDLGISQATGGSIAVRKPELFLEWLAKYGGDKIILGADVKQGNVAISGWQEDSAVALFPFLERFLAHGVSHVICTDITKDGKMQGPSFDLYTDIMANFSSIKLIASGGVTTVDDLRKLRNMGLSGAIVGKAIYEGSIKLEDLKEFLD